MNRTRIIEILNTIKTEENSEKIDNAINKLNSLSDETIEKICDGKSEDEIKKILGNAVLDNKKKEQRIDLNDMFYYGRDGNTVHIHLVEPDLHYIKDKLGPEGFYKYMKDKLEDAMASLQEVFKKDETMEEVFAVSPIFYHEGTRRMHEELGFEKIQECMPGTKTQMFIDMFNKGDKKRKVFYTRIKREDFLKKTYRRYQETRREDDEYIP